MPQIVYQKNTRIHWYTSIKTGIKSIPYGYTKSSLVFIGIPNKRI